MSTLAERIEALERHMERENANEDPGYSSSTWSPTPTGFSVVPPNATYRYVLIGKMCTLFIGMPTAGTSNGTGFTIPLPFASANPGTSPIWFAPLAYSVDNGVAFLGGWGQINWNSSTLTLNKTTAGAASWTNANGKFSNLTITYEIA